MQLIFNIKNQLITRADGETPVAKSKNYLKAKFNFQTDEWEGLEKTVIFKKKSKVLHVLLDDDMKCFVPHELLDTGILYVSVFAGDLITTNSCTVKILESGYEDGTKPDDPTPDIYEQIMNRLDELSVGQVDSDQIKIAVNEYLAENPIETLTDEEAQQIIVDYVTEHKEELKGDKGDTGENGSDGKDGIDGKSAYEIAVESGYVGTEQAFYECLANLPILYNILNYTEADNGKVLGIEDGQIKWVNGSASSVTEPDEPATEPTKGYIALTFDDGYAGQYGEQMMSVLNDKSLPFGRAIFTNSAYQGESNSAYYSVETYKGMHDTLGTEIFTHAPTVNAGFINGTGSTALSSGWLKTWLNTTAYGVTSNSNKDTLLEILEPSIAVVPYKTGFTVSDLTEEMLADLSTDRSYKTIITGTSYQIWSVPTVYLNIVNPIDSTSSYDLGASEYTDSVCYNRVLADDVTEDFIKGLSGKGAFICIHDQYESNVASLNNILSWCESNNVEVISNTELVNKLKKQTE